MLDFTEEHKQAQGVVRAWCRERLEPRVPELEANAITPYPLMRELAAALGIGDMARARLEAGAGSGAEPRPGQGDSTAALTAILMMELSRVCPGFAMAFGASLGLFGGAVLSRGTPEQKREWALPVLTFEKVGAWALTEPGAGSDAFGSMKTTAKRTEGGFRLSGQKTFITNAPYADVFVVYARIGDPSPGGNRETAEGHVRAFLVPRSAKGLECGPPMKKMGMHSSPTGEVFLDDVLVPGKDLLGGENQDDARTAARASLKGERFGMTPMCLGIVDRCLEESVRYAKEREQWGKPLASFQLVQEKIAKIYATRSVIFALLMRQLESEKKGVALTVEEASASKLTCARATTECALEAVQIKGGAGYMQGSVVEMMARDAKLFQIGGGTDEIQILRIARELLSR
jgi:alkylation response protein AidB-like acyl-CoA dehydrogenase